MHIAADLVLGRPDGAALPLVSEAMLHLFDNSMSMLLLATRTDMLDVLKKKDVKIATVEDFCFPCNVSMVFPACTISSGGFGPSM